MHALIADAQHLNEKETLHGNFYYLQQCMLHFKKSTINKSLPFVLGYIFFALYTYMYMKNL